MNHIELEMPESKKAYICASVREEKIIASRSLVPAISPLLGPYLNSRITGG
jgi:hypothetical protein